MIAPGQQGGRCTCAFTHAAFRSFGLVCASILLASCYAFGVPVKSGEDEPFAQEKLEFIKIGQSTKADIKSAMSAFPVETRDGPQVLELEPVEYQDGEVWLYGAQRGEVRWFYMWQLWDEGDVGVTDTHDYHYLKFTFDENGVLADYEYSVSEGKGCNPEGVCAHAGAYMLLAGADEDAQAKSFTPPARGCGIYLYARGLKFPAPVWIGSDWVGWLLDNKTFLYLEVDTGFHRIDSKTQFELLSKYVTLDCTAGELYFFELDHKGSVRRDDIDTHWKQEDASAQSTIMKRRRLMNISHASAMPARGRN